MMTLYRRLIPESTTTLDAFLKKAKDASKITLSAYHEKPQHGPYREDLQEGPVDPEISARKRLRILGENADGTKVRYDEDFGTDYAVPLGNLQLLMRGEFEGRVMWAGELAQLRRERYQDCCSTENCSS
jgi:hypothetical protein